MVSSKGLVVVGDEGAGGAGVLGGLVVRYGCCEGEEPLQYARDDAGAGTSAVAFEAELVFGGPVDRFDGLAQRAQETVARAGAGSVLEAGRMSVMPAALSASSNAVHR